MSYRRLYIRTGIAAMELTTTNKGKQCALYDGYSYNFKRQNVEGTIFWRCSKERSKRCRGNLKSKNGEVLSTSEHQCGAPDEAQLEVKKVLQTAKKRAREEETAISKIYTQELGELHNKGYDFIAEMPAQHSAKRVLYQQRCKSQGHQVEPEKRDDVVLDEDILKMNDGSSFLLADDNSDERILIFSGPLGKDGLASCEDFFMDGTFKSSTKQFSQIYSIHADFGSSTEETNIYPVVFALLPNKKKETYVRLFQLILNAVPNWTPRQVNVDYEVSAISALKEVFATVKVRGCYFHMKKCLWRKVQDLGLTRDYKENEEVRNIVKMCASLAFLNPDDVCNGWLEIYSRKPEENDKLTEFLDYFVSNWMEDERNDIHQWNCYNRRHRTTNSVEGWNNKLNSMVQRPNPRIKDLIQCLKTEAEHSAYMYMTKQLNLEGKRRKLKYKKMDAAIQKTIKKYEENGNILACLRTLSYLQKFD